MAKTQTTVCAKLRPDEYRALEALENLERLSKSDIVRRAIWHYAQHMGVAERPHTETSTP